MQFSQLFSYGWRWWLEGDPVRTNLLVLVRRDGGEHGLWEGEGSRALADRYGLHRGQLLAALFPDHVHPWLVLVHGVQDDLESEKGSWVTICSQFKKKKNVCHFLKNMSGFDCKSYRQFNFRKVYFVCQVLQQASSTGVWTSPRANRRHSAGSS